MGRQSAAHKRKTFTGELSCKGGGALVVFACLRVCDCLCVCVVVFRFVMLDLFGVVFASFSLFCFVAQNRFQRETQLIDKFPCITISVANEKEGHVSPRTSWIDSVPLGMTARPTCSSPRQVHTIFLLGCLRVTDILCLGR